MALNLSQMPRKTSMVQGVIPLFGLGGLQKVPVWSNVRNMLLNPA